MIRNSGFERFNRQFDAHELYWLVYLLLKEVNLSKDTSRIIQDSMNSAEWYLEIMDTLTEKEKEWRPQYEKLHKLYNRLVKKNVRSLSRL